MARHRGVAISPPDRPEAGGRDSLPECHDANTNASLPQVASDRQTTANVSEPLHGVRVRSLDGVRGIAILAVVAFHAGVPGADNGAGGVIVFFVLSGYLITTLLLSRPITKGSLGIFYLKRLLRLYPALLVVLATCLAIAVFMHDGQKRHDLFAEIVRSSVYIQNFALASQPEIEDWGYLGHMWSLAVEEQFYLVWPLVLVGVTALPISRRGRFAAIGALLVAAALWRTHLSAAGLHNRVGVGLDGNAESLLVGCALAYALVTYRPKPGPRVAGLLRIAPLVALVALLVIFTGKVTLPLDQTRLVTALLTASVIVAIALQPYGPAARLLAWRPLAWVGLVSYGLYLWHLIVFHVFKDHVHIVTMGEKLLWAPAMLAVTAIMTIASYYLVEKPFNALKDRLPVPHAR